MDGWGGGRWVGGWGGGLLLGCGVLRWVGRQVWEWVVVG